MAAQVKRLDEMAWKNIGIIKSMGDETFARDMLEARRDFLSLRLRHEPALKKVYIDAADNVAKELRNLKPAIGDLTRNHLIALEKALRQEADKIHAASSALIKSGIGQAFALGSRPLDNYILQAFRDVKAPLSFARLQRGFADINASAVEVFWARTRGGLTLSDRLWENSQTARKAIRDLIQTGIAQGRDVVEVARDLEHYVRDGAKTLTEDYENMMRRMETRIPKDLSYEALRLVRTEYSIAFMEGVYARGQLNPAYEGVQWMLSDAHPEPDICDDLASADLYGMGRGVYKKGEEPVHPHPNCLCYVVPVLIERQEITHKLAQWLEDPSSQPDIEEWYNEIYRGQIGSAY
jgi:hypothetical protein